MAEMPIFKWQRQVEEILKELPVPSDAEELNNVLQAIIDKCQTACRPEGSDWIVIKTLIEIMSQDLYPMACAWAAFQLGVAYERYQRERSSGKP